MFGVRCASTVLPFPERHEAGIRAAAMSDWFFPSDVWPCALRVPPCVSVARGASLSVTRLNVAAPRFVSPFARWRSSWMFRVSAVMNKAAVCICAQFLCGC